MEYLLVMTNKDLKKKRVSVLINGEKNGYINRVLMLDEGIVQVSVDLPKAEKKEINLTDTSIEQPMKVVISI